MQYFQDESMRAISTFVRQFRNEPTFNENMLHQSKLIDMILQFAGGDDVGIALNRINHNRLILLTFEERCKPTFTPATFGTINLHVGEIHGREVAFFVHGVKQNGWHLPYAATDAVVVRTNYSAEDGAASMRVCETTIAEWNADRQRGALMQTLMIHFRNQKSVCMALM